MVDAVADAVVVLVGSGRSARVPFLICLSAIVTESGGRGSLKAQKIQGVGHCIGVERRKAVQYAGLTHSVDFG